MKNKKSFNKQTLEHIQTKKQICFNNCISYLAEYILYSKIEESILKDIRKKQK